MHPNQQLYNEFSNTYASLHNNCRRDVAFQNAQKAWNLIKKNGPDAVKNEILNMRSKLKTNQSLSSPFGIMWANKKNSSPLTLPAASPVFTSELVKASASALSIESSTPSISSSTSNTQSTIPRECFKQQSVQYELNTVNEQITALTSLKSTGLWRSDNCKELNGLIKTRSKLKCAINRLKTNQAAQCRMRKNRRLRMTRLLDNHPEIAEEISSIIRHTSGKPSLEESQCGLLGAIMDIANSVVVAADSHRRTDAIQSCLTLDSLKEQLNVRGYQLSRTSTYYRLLPKNSRTIDDQRHVHTVPVRIRRPENSLHKHHGDTKFAQSTIRDLKHIACTLGNEMVFYLSQDDKCRIPLGIPAAHKQAPLIMSMKIQIKLPDHDFAIATKHKLIPSVYGACIINDERVSYSGPAFAAVRSGKHDHSSAIAHANDFDTLVQLPEFEKVALLDGTVKPVVILSVDGGPDENPRYPTTIKAATSIFKKYNLDALFIVTNAPGRSAFNEVERRMAPLSHELSGLILPYDYYGNHLDNSGKTIDDALERRNFQRAGEALSQIWAQLKIDNHPVVSRYIKPLIDNPAATPCVNECEHLLWASEHIHQSQYLLKVVRCNNTKCCKPWRSYYFQILNQRFIPAPVAYQVSKLGRIPSRFDANNSNIFNLFERLHLQKFVKEKLMMDFLPFDRYCLSLQQDIQRRLCAICGLYFSSIASMKRHKVLHSIRYKKKEMLINYNDDDDNDAGEPELAMNSNDHYQQEQVDNNSAPIIMNIFDFFKSDFEQVKKNES